MAVAKLETNKALVKAVSNRFNLERIASATLGGDCGEALRVNIELLLTKEDLQAIISDMAKGE